MSCSTRSHRNIIVKVIWTHTMLSSYLKSKRLHIFVTKFIKQLTLCSWPTSLQLNTLLLKCHRTRNIVINLLSLQEISLNLHLFDLAHIGFCNLFAHPLLELFVLFKLERLSHQCRFRSLNQHTSTLIHIFCYLLVFLLIGLFLIGFIILGFIFEVQYLEKNFDVKFLARVH